MRHALLFLFTNEFSVIREGTFGVTKKENAKLKH
jgi:hypothetical protein